MTTVTDFVAVESGGGSDVGAEKGAGDLGTTVVEVASGTRREKWFVGVAFDGFPGMRSKTGQVVEAVPTAAVVQLEQMR